MDHAGHVLIRSPLERILPGDGNALVRRLEEFGSTIPSILLSNPTHPVPDTVPKPRLPFSCENRHMQAAFHAFASTTWGDKYDKYDAVRAIWMIGGFYRLGLTGRL